MPPPQKRISMDLPKRKHPRLKTYDYSQNGYYYVTIHIAPNGYRLSHIRYDKQLNAAAVLLTEAGTVLQTQLLDLANRFPGVVIQKYVIMPTHLHAIIELSADTAGASPRPTLSDVVGALKSLTTRECNRRFGTPGRLLFQKSFYESVLRNQADYFARWKYIDENPLKWSIDPEDL